MDHVALLDIAIVGAGIFGLWQAFELARRGHAVTLYEAMCQADSGGASRFAGAMLAPFCESEAAEPIVRELGLEGLASWREAFPLVTQRGNLVVAPSRDQGEFRRFQRMTQGHRVIGAEELGSLEPDLAGRFGSALFFDGEAHVAPRQARAALITRLRSLGVNFLFDHAVAEPLWRAGAAGGVVIDCRGIAARTALTDLRGVRGEMAVLRTTDIILSRPVRLLHPRFPLYLVPWGEHCFMIGATMVERDDAGPVTVRSALEMLGAAYAIHPAFGEAEIIEMSAAVRPAFTHNIPRVVARGRVLHVNGAYRHGYLLAPVLARAAADLVLEGRRREGIVVDG